MQEEFLVVGWVVVLLIEWGGVEAAHQQPPEFIAFPKVDGAFDDPGSLRAKEQFRFLKERPGVVGPVYTLKVAQAPNWVGLQLIGGMVDECCDAPGRLAFFVEQHKATRRPVFPSRILRRSEDIADVHLERGNPVGVMAINPVCCFEE